MTIKSTLVATALLFLVLTSTAAAESGAYNAGKVFGYLLPVILIVAVVVVLVRRSNRG